MTFLPIVARELRVRSRDRNTWRVRALAASAAFVIGAPLLLFSQPGGGGGISGQDFFYVLTGLALLFCLFEGARQTSDTISSERREGTLGLLFLTDLKGYDIVLGKMAVSSINSLFGLLAVFPILSLGLLAGGITVGEFWRMSLGLVTALTFSLAIGMWVSARTADERRAILVTIFLVAAIMGGLPMLDTLVRFRAPKQPVFSLASPVCGCFFASDSAYRTAPHNFWWSQGTSLVFAAGLLLHSSLTITPLATAETRPRVARGKSLQKRRIIESDPIAWLAGANTAIPRAITALLLLNGLLALFELYEILSAAPPAAGTITFATETWVANIVIGALSWFLVAYMASDFFLQLRRNGLLELLLCTPQSSTALVRGHRQAMWTMLRWPVLLWLGTSVVGQLPMFAQVARAGVDELFVALIVSQALQLAEIPLTIVALTYAGAWFALTSRRTAHALGKLVTLVLILPFIMGTVLAPLIVMSTGASPFWFYLAAPTVMLLADVFFIVWTGKRLKSEFPEAAVRQITGEPRAKSALRDENEADEYFSLLGDPRQRNRRS